MTDLISPSVISHPRSKSLSGRDISQPMQETTKRLNPKERKRLQNRIAQRTYRENQKTRLRTLEEAVAKFSEGITATAPNSIQCMLPQDAEYDTIDSGISIPENSPPIETEKTLLPYPTLDFESQPWPPDPIFGSVGLPRSQKELVRPALHRAAAGGNESMARLLLEQGADIAVKDSLGQTALHVAVDNEHNAVIKLLLDNNIDPNIKDASGRTALFCAIQAGNVEVVKKLLESFVDINMKDMYGNSPLHVAVESGSEPMVLLLLKHGADINS